MTDPAGIPLEGEPRPDPARGVEPVSSSAGCEPLHRGGSGFRTHQLVEVHPNRLEFVATTTRRWFHRAPLAAGLLAGFLAAFASSDLWDVLGQGAISVAFLAVGFWFHRNARQPIVFDRHAGAFWMGKRPGPDPGSRTGREKFAPLSDIQSLQLLEKLVRSGGSDQGDATFRSIELNLVLADGRRICVQDHGEISALRRDGETLAAFLGKPLWQVPGRPFQV